MDNIQKVQFRNVGRSYFPQTRVECHYKMTSGHTWTNSDWVGLFKVGWTTVKEYYTYLWALVPEGYTEGRDADCCVQFQTSYMPSPGADLYQFVYVDAGGEVCGISAHFLFSTPGALDELVTLENDKPEEEGAGEGLTMVVPKAQILQGHLEECQKELKDLKLTMEQREEEKERERKWHEQDRQELMKERDDMKEEISELMTGLRLQREELEKVELKHKDSQSSQQSASAELLDLLKERAEQQQQIRELADDNSLLTQHKRQAEAELERTKERVKKMTLQRIDEEEEKKTLKAETEEAQKEIRQLRDRVEVSERSGDALRRELGELSGLQGHSHAELHQTRLQMAQVNMQLSQATLAVREGEATWAMEKEQLRHSAELDQERLQKLCRELQRKEEWLQEERAEREKLEAEIGGQNNSNLAHLSDARKEMQELKASLRAAQKQMEQLQLENQTLLEQVREHERRLDLEVETKWYEATSVVTAEPDTTPSEEEEEEEKEEKEEEEVSEALEMTPIEETWEDVAQTEPAALDEREDKPCGLVMITEPVENACRSVVEITQPVDKPCRVVEITQLLPAQEAEEDRESWEDDETPQYVWNDEEECVVDKPPRDPMLSEFSEYPLW